ncbi:MAG TPA: ArdC-like ssDNA-binding domain-containing protein [Baekduia sp.]|nr:ArdC-like ssDNA-binding domain-containing protein [Baekduia sp.]
MARRFKGKPLTDEERDARRRADRDRLEQAARALLTTDGWQRWIKVRSSNGLSRYSLGNQMLIAIEAHARGITPTYVAGFRAWLQLNRVPRKGEGIRILAPVTVKDRDEHGEQTGSRRVFFKAVTVWDVSGTDPLPGKEPVPLAPPAQPITGDSHHHLITPLTAHATELGYSVESVSSPTTALAAGATPRAARSSSPQDPLTNRSAPSPTNWPTRTGSDTSSTRELRPRSSSTASPTAYSAQSASTSAANRSHTSPAGAKTAPSTPSANTHRRSTRPPDASKKPSNRSPNRPMTPARSKPSPPEIDAGRSMAAAP